ncbi:hypothetical protein [Leucobacter triazinivorans]|uniref:Uncharacterized protein n=1 Tax=Leucobacter triazinivorans TaxID=1784719 RepID=A0A4P6KHA7_9MICO|nr:hypothetical protein [Leucobacter triazinivorans]QBE49633.1 hypothetical protein EVS81_13030 [Leucobacter triazinivorans]
MTREDRIAQAQAKYEHALQQAQSAPSSYTKRELKRADQALKAAKAPGWIKWVALGIIAVAVAIIVLVNVANANQGDNATQACITQLEQTLSEAGSDRQVTADERAAWVKSRVVV